MGSFCSFLNCDEAIIRPQIRPRKIPGLLSKGLNYSLLFYIFQKKIQNDITLMYTQTAEAVKEIRNTGQATEPPTSASDSQEPPSSTSSSDNYSDINKYYDVSSAVHDHSEQMSPHVNVNIGDNLKDATISQTLARETVTDNTVSDHSKVNMNVHEPNIKDGLEANVHIDLSEASTIHATQTKKMKDTHKAEVKLPKQPKPKSSILSSFKPQVSIMVDVLNFQTLVACQKGIG